MYKKICVPFFVSLCAAHCKLHATFHVTFAEKCYAPASLDGCPRQTLPLRAPEVQHTSDVSSTAILFRATWVPDIAGANLLPLGRRWDMVVLRQLMAINVYACLGCSFMVHLKISTCWHRLAGMAASHCGQHERNRNETSAEFLSETSSSKQCCYGIMVTHSHINDENRWKKHAESLSKSVFLSFVFPNWIAK